MEYRNWTPESQTPNVPTQIVFIAESVSFSEWLVEPGPVRHALFEKKKLMLKMCTGIDRLRDVDSGMMNISNNFTYVIH